VAEALRTAVHETAVHHGLRQQFGSNFAEYDAFLDRVYNAMRDGRGDQIAAQFGAGMDGLARTYRLGTEQPDGTLALKPAEQRRLAEELLARYAERFSPRQLDRAPGILKKAINLVKDGFSRFQGIHFSDHDAFRVIQDAWRGAEPLRDPDAANNLIAKRIANNYEPDNLRSGRAADPGPDELTRDARNAAKLREGVSAASGVANSREEIRASSDRLGAIPKAAGTQYSDRILSQRAPFRVTGRAGDEHDIRFPRDPNANKYLFTVTRPDSDAGPYGVAPSFPATREDGYGANHATADQYLRRLALSDELFGSGHELEGYFQDPETGTWRVVSSQPRIDNFRPATIPEIASWMAGRGFHSIDERTYYNPERRVIALQADPSSVVMSDIGNIHAINVAPFEVRGALAKHLDDIVRDPARLSGIENPEAIVKQLQAHVSELDPATQAAAARQLKADEAELTRLRDLAQKGDLSPEDQRRMDDIEFGPLLKRDVDAELGPDSPDEPPIDILKRAIEDMRRTMPPEKGERVHARRTAEDPNEPDPVRAFNAAEDQLQYEKGSRKIWRAIANNVFDRYEGNIAAITRDLTSGKFTQEGHREYEAEIYRAMKVEIAARRADALADNNQGQVDFLDAYRNQLDDWANTRRTQWGKEGAAWQDVLFSHDGLVSNARAGYRKEIERKIKSDPNFAAAIEQVKRIARDSGVDAAADPAVQRALALAQQAQDAKTRTRKPEDWALAMARSLVEQATSAQEPARVSPGVEEMLKRFRREIEAQMREGDIQMDPNTMAKVRASKTIGDAMRSWPYLERVHELVRSEGMKQFADNPAIREKFANLNLELPFSQTHLARFAREQGVNIRELFTQHREQIGKTIESLSDFLTRQTSLSKEQATLIEKTVGNFINEAVAVRRKAEFEAIINKANEGQPREAGRGTTLDRLLNLVHMGAFADEQVANALAPVYGYKDYKPELDTDLQKIGDELNRLRTAGRDGFQTEAARMELNRTIANYAQIRGWEYWSNILKGNVVTTIPGHIIGFINETLSGLGQMFYRLGAEHRFDPATFAAAFTDLGRGFMQAIPETGYILKTGAEPSRFASIEELRNDRERRTWRAGYFESLPTRRVLERTRIPFAAAFGKYVIDTPYIYTHRAISALHNLIYSGFGRATELMAAVEFARKNYGLGQEKALDWAREALDGKRGQVEAFNQQADNEGLSGLAKKLRVQELLDQNVPQPIRDQADMWGTRANAYQDPHGILGALSSSVSKLAREYPVLSQFVPIVRIPTNLINTAIDLTPLGFLRYWRAEEYLTRSGKMDLSSEQIEQLKGQLLAKAIAGTSLLVGGMIATSIRLPNGQFLLNIHGAGPQQPTDKYQLMDQGWQPYSIQIGNTYIPYEATPAWLALAVIGNWQDAQRYKDMPPGPEAVSYMLGRSMGAFLDRSFVRGLSDLMETLKQVGARPDDPTALEHYMANIAKSFIPIGGMGVWKQVYQQYLNDKLYRAKGFGAIARDLPFAADAAGLKPVINGLGEPVHLSPLTHRFWSTGSEQKVWEFLNEHSLTISSPNVHQILGKAPTEEQKYDFAVFRGQHMRELLTARMEHLGAIQDPDLLEKAFRQLEERATALGKRDVISGKSVPTF
jgi:hypothetical protein